ncbi:hypothetical protein SLA2020_367260 [Shorea laevis]
MVTRATYEPGKEEVARGIALPHHVQLPRYFGRKLGNGCNLPSESGNPILASHYAHAHPMKYETIPGNKDAGCSSDRAYICLSPSILCMQFWSEARVRY